MTKQKGMLRLLLPLVLFLFGCFTPQPTAPPGPSAYDANLAILGDVDHLVPGSMASFLVQPRAPYTRQRWPAATVEVYLNGPDGATRQVYSGVTGADGVARVSFPVPEDLAAPEQVLEVRTALPPDAGGYTPGEFRTFRDVHVGRTYNVLVSNDKPVYQPGQLIHLRALALDTLNLRPADGISMTLTVADPQGNKLLRETVAASAYGIASIDFPLDTQAPSGDYVITAEMGPTVSTRSVEVKPYSLPRFEVTFAPGRPYYLPGETAEGTVEARYFFGKPVAAAQVRIVGTLDYGGGARTVMELSGATDAEGVYTYAFTVPPELEGRLDNKSIDIDLAISVVDTANHEESIDDSVTVAEKVLLIDAVPESGRLRQGLDDLVYLDVTYPDGVAAHAVLTVTDAFSQTFTAVSDTYGQAVITLSTPHEGLTPLLVTAADSRGNVVEQPLLLGADDQSTLAALLLRPARAEYAVGDTLHVDILAHGGLETVYLDIIKDRQTFGLATLPLGDGVARAAIDLDGSLLGTLELNAYAVDAEGQIVRDRRHVLVNPAPAEVSVSADKEEYRPGETAVLDIAVTRNGEPQQAALGVAIVDESVYAIEDVNSSFARTYFLLNRELQEPRYGIHNFVDLERADPSPYDAAPDSVRYAERARQVALAGAFAEILADDAVQADAAHADAARVPLAADPWGLAAALGNRLYLAAPLVGLALYDGSRRRRRLLIGLVVFALGAFVWGACGSPAAAPAAETAAETAAMPDAQANLRDTEAPGEKPRLRQFFPETLYWLPELVTDAAGRAQIEVPMADTITTWRASILVSDKEGNLGSADLPLRAFQDFFVEPDLPRFLTVGDEIDVPIAVYNYLETPQTITLAVTPADWFEVRGAPQLTFATEANEVLAAYLPIRVKAFGAQELEITAVGENGGDAVLRTVDVLPNGQRSVEVSGGELAASQAITLPIPPEAIEGTERVTVKVYGGVVSQVLGGLEGMLQMPYGCFEQTSSVNYPNVLVLDYLKRTGRASPRLALQAEQLLSLGYQRLLGFEVGGEPGGFSLYGDPPADPGLTAYGLMQLGDMARVAYVDPELLERIVDYLALRQERDGSWAPLGVGTGGNEMDDAEQRLATTAYITWGLADAEFAEDRTVRRAVRYLERSLDRSLEQMARGDEGKDTLSTYTLALAANALLAGGGESDAVLAALVARAEGVEGQVAWRPGAETYLGAYGQAGTIEVTAIAAQALLRSGAAPDTAAGALRYLAANRDPYGSFYTTQATIQALKALVMAAEPQPEDATAAVTIIYSRADGSTSTAELTAELMVDAANADLVQSVVLEDADPAAPVAISVAGNRRLHYQVVSEYYLPWEKAATEATEATGATGAVAAPMRIAVHYDRSELAVNETVGVRAEVELLGGDTAGTLIVDLGLPPGFAPVTEDLDALVDRGAIERYEITPRRILLYLTDVASGKVLTLDYRLQARYPVDAQAPGSRVYDYYAPDQAGSTGPQRVTVTLGTP